MKRIVTWAFGTPRRATLSAGVLVVLVASASALAAWVLLTGVGGKGGAKVNSQTITPVLSLTPDYTGTAVDPSQVGTVKASVQTGAAGPGGVVLNSLTAGAITSNNAACDTTGASFTYAPSQTNFSQSSTTADVTLGTISVPANFDKDCAGSQLDIAFTGTTTP